MSKKEKSVAIYNRKLEKAQKRNAKLSVKDEEEIKRLYGLGVFSQAYLARKFNVSKTCIGYIVSEERRKKKNEYQREWARRHKLSKEVRKERKKELLEYKKKLFKGEE